MQRLSLGVVGIIVIALGVIWTLQGSDVLGGSTMSGHPQWTLIGLALVVAGLGLVGFAAIRKGPRG
jgi:hypothetical protein